MSLDELSQKVKLATDALTNVLNEAESIMSQYKDKDNEISELKNRLLLKNDELARGVMQLKILEEKIDSVQKANDDQWQRFQQTLDALQEDNYTNENLIIVEHLRDLVNNFKYEREMANQATLESMLTISDLASRNNLISNCNQIEELKESNKQLFEEFRCQQMNSIDAHSLVDKILQIYQKFKNP